MIYDFSTFVIVITLDFVWTKKPWTLAFIINKETCGFYNQQITKFQNIINYLYYI